jgi:hypothetical protein
MCEILQITRVVVASCYYFVLHISVYYGPG